MIGRFLCRLLAGVKTLVARLAFSCVSLAAAIDKALVGVPTPEEIHIFSSPPTAVLRAKCVLWVIRYCVYIEVKSRFF